MFTCAQSDWLTQVGPEFLAARQADAVDAWFPTLIACWFKQFPIALEDDDDFFEGQPQLVDQMKRLMVEKIRQFLQYRFRD
ncbi:hypothetical protein ARMSODRAFT_1023681 [Armillaria solidipes]|uniref:Uncharacterized protein n=1 Tax=Armillaria solidipes TaxID=1076256 RepID=A0A2H3BCL8_9AGAR|nr:hypothetical protein ARMSODRAFT_1023681 [Armillaria solidipes]